MQTPASIESVKTCYTVDFQANLPLYVNVLYWLQELLIQKNWTCLVKHALTKLAVVWIIFSVLLYADFNSLTCCEMQKVSNATEVLPSAVN